MLGVKFSSVKRFTDGILFSLFVQVAQNVSFNNSIKIKTIIKKYINGQWQKRWDGDNHGRCLYNIMRKVGNNLVLYSKNRRHDVIFTRLKLGKCGLRNTLSTLKIVDSNICETCNVVEYVGLIEHEMSGKKVHAERKTP